MSDWTDMSHLDHLTRRPNKPVNNWKTVSIVDELIKNPRANAAQVIDDLRDFVEPIIPCRTHGYEFVELDEDLNRFWCFKCGDWTHLEEVK